MEKLHLVFNIFKITFPLVSSTEQFLHSCSLAEKIISVYFRLNSLKDKAKKQSPCVIGLGELNPLTLRIPEAKPKGGCQKHTPSEGV